MTVWDGNNQGMCYWSQSMDVGLHPGFLVRLGVPPSFSDLAMTMEQPRGCMQVMDGVRKPHLIAAILFSSYNNDQLCTYHETVTPFLYTSCSRKPSFAIFRPPRCGHDRSCPKRIPKQRYLVFQNDPKVTLKRAECNIPQTAPQPMAGLGKFTERRGKPRRLCRRLLGESS
jgi:hypothetical protein